MRGLAESIKFGPFTLARVVGWVAHLSHRFGGPLGVVFVVRLHRDFSAGSQGPAHLGWALEFQKVAVPILKMPVGYFLRGWVHGSGTRLISKGYTQSKLATHGHSTKVKDPTGGRGNIPWQATCPFHKNMTDISSAIGCKKRLQTTSQGETIAQLKLWCILGLDITSDPSAMPRDDHRDDIKPKELPVYSHAALDHMLTEALAQDPRKPALQPVPR
jgi:hypothetical protein